MSTYHSSERCLVVNNNLRLNMAIKILSCSGSIQSLHERTLSRSYVRFADWFSNVSGL